jgi:DNA-binding NarL/FixJ family response regulator
MKFENKTRVATGRRRVFVVDQFPITRLAVSEWLGLTPDLGVCGEADDESTAFTALRHSKPDLVVTEVLHQQDLGFIRSLHERYPKVPILVFSFRDEEWYAPRALEAGADGYLMKGVSPAGLVDGIRAALEGRVVLSPQMRARLLVKCTRRRRLSASLRRARPRRCPDTKAS